MYTISIVVPSSPIPPHKCYKNWSDSSCAMESDIILQGFKCSERMHGLRYIWMIGDGDTSVYSSICTARKVTNKYKKQRLLSKSGKSKPDSLYGDAALQPDIPDTKLEQLCKEYLGRLQMNEHQQQRLAIETHLQSDDPIGRWG